MLNQPLVSIWFLIPFNNSYTLFTIFVRWLNLKIRQHHLSLKYRYSRILIFHKVCNSQKNHFMNHFHLA